MHQSTLEEIKFALWAQNLNLGTPPSCAFFLLYPFNTDVNVVIQKTPHHGSVTIWCQSSHDGLMMSYSFFLQECLHMYLVSRAVAFALNGNSKVDALILPFVGWKTGAPGAYMWHSSPGTVMWPCIIQCIKNILTIGMQNHMDTILAPLTNYKFIYSLYQSSACLTLVVII